MPMAMMPTATFPSTTGTRLMAESRIPRRYQHCGFDNFTAYNEQLTKALQQVSNVDTYQIVSLASKKIKEVRASTDPIVSEFLNPRIDLRNPRFKSLET